jgi:YD repeat-containing protein
VFYAYNAQGQQIWTKDQAGNEMSTTFDRAGRQLTRTMSAVSGYVDDVKRIEMAYEPARHGVDGDAV